MVSSASLRLRGLSWVHRRSQEIKVFLNFPYFAGRCPFQFNATADLLDVKFGTAGHNIIFGVLNFVLGVLLICFITTTALGSSTFKGLMGARMAPRGTPLRLQDRPNV